MDSVASVRFKTEEHWLHREICKVVEESLGSPFPVFRGGMLFRDAVAWLTKLTYGQCKVPAMMMWQPCTVGIKYVREAVHGSCIFDVDEMTGEQLDRMAYVLSGVTFSLRDVGTTAETTATATQGQGAPMTADEVSNARPKTLTIVLSLPSEQRAAELKSTVQHLLDKGFPNVHCIANPFGKDLDVAPNMYSTRGSSLMLAALFGPSAATDLDDEIQYVFLIVDTARLGPMENFYTCVRWLTLEGIHFMGFGDWKASASSW